MSSTLSPNCNKFSLLSKKILFVFAVSKVTSSPKDVVELTSTALTNVDIPDTFNVSVSICPVMFIPSAVVANFSLPL